MTMTVRKEEVHSPVSKQPVRQDAALKLLSGFQTQETETERKYC